jgi:hypothetical protein
VKGEHRALVRLDAGGLAARQRDAEHLAGGGTLGGRGSIRGDSERRSIVGEAGDGDVGSSGSAGRVTEAEHAACGLRQAAAGKHRQRTGEEAPVPRRGGLESLRCHQHRAAAGDATPLGAGHLPELDGAADVLGEQVMAAGEPGEIDDAHRSGEVRLTEHGAEPRPRRCRVRSNGGGSERGERGEKRAAERCGHGKRFFSREDDEDRRSA